MQSLSIYSDGGARGNPGPAGIGVVFCDDSGKIIHKHKEYIGEATNNQAEYKALIRALEILQKSSWHKNNGNGSYIKCYLDSKLVVEQLCGNYKVKNSGIKVFVEQIADLLANINKRIEFIHIPRENNIEADKLVNMALDEQRQK